MDVFSGSGELLPCINFHFACSANKDLTRSWSLLCLFFEYFLQEMDKNKHSGNLSIKYLNGCLKLLLYCNLQGCCQSAMVARAMSLFRQEKDKGSFSPPAPPAAWGPSEDYRSITATFQYLETSGISIKPLLVNMTAAVAHPRFPPVCRLVLGSHICERCSGSSPEEIRGDVPHEGQQPPQTHADPVSEDVLRPHQRAY